MAHHCHAIACYEPVPPEMLMCKRHWFLVPQWIRSSVWNSYRPGQCDDKSPSDRWFIAADRAIMAVAVAEKLMTQEQANARIAQAIENHGGNKVRPSRFAVASSGNSSSSHGAQLRTPTDEESGTGTDRFDAVVPRCVESASEEADDHGQPSRALAVGEPTGTLPGPAGQGNGDQPGQAEPGPLLVTALSSSRPGGAGQGLAVPADAMPGEAIQGLDPFLRWVGSKRWLVNRLVPEIVALQPKLYIEPFLGAGAIALALPGTFPMVLNDYSQPLINLWTAIQQAPKLVGGRARALYSQLGNNREGYLLGRKAFNATDQVDMPMPVSIELAALMLYLIATGYNGVWRVNKSGGYNVPFGTVTSPRISDGDQLTEIAEQLARATFYNVDFHLMLGLIIRFGNRDPAAFQSLVVFADPPYHAGFDTYISEGFSDEQHAALADDCRLLAEAGAHVYITNADTPFVREIYSWATRIEEVSEARTVSQDAKNRKAAPCLLIKG